MTKLEEFEEDIRSLARQYWGKAAVDVKNHKYTAIITITIVKDEKDKPIDN